MKEAFGEFFKLLKTDPKKAVENLFDKIFGAFKDWFASGPTTTGMGEMLKNLLITGLKLVAGLAPKIIKTAAKFIADFAKSLGEFLNNDKGVTGAVGEGIGGAFMEAFNAIKDAVVNDLGPALIDLFMVLFKKFGPPIIAVLSGIWTVIFIKSLVSAAISAAAGAAVKVGIEVLAQKVGGMMSKSSGMGKVDPKSASKTAKGTKGMAEGLNDMLKAIGKISLKDIAKAALKMAAMAASLIPAMIVFAIGLVAVALVLMPVPFLALLKAIAGLAGAVVAAAMMIGALFLYDKVAKGKEGSMMVSMIKLAALFTVGGVALGVAAIIVSTVWGAVPLMGILKATAAIAMMSISAAIMLVPLLAVGFILNGPQAGIILAGLAGMAILFVAASALGLVTPLFVGAWTGVDGLGLVTALMKLNAMVVGLIPMIAVVAALGGLLTAFLVPTLAGIAGLFILTMALGYGADTFADAANDIITAFDSVDLVGFMKSAVALGMLAMTVVGITTAGIILAALSPLMLVAIVGLKAADWFIWGAAGAISNMVEEIVKIPIDNPSKIMKKIEVIGKIVQIVSTLANLGLKAAKMAIVASLLSDDSPKDMMNSMGDFVGGIIDKVILLVDALVKAAQSIGADPKTLDGAKALAGIIGAVANLASALIEPLTALEGDTGSWWGGNKGESMSEKIKAVTGGVGEIMDALKDKLVGPDGMIVSLLNVFNNPILKKEKPETLKARADTLKSLFQAILAIVKAMAGLQAFEEEDTSAWYQKSNARSAAEVLGGMFEQVKEILEMDSLAGVVKAALDLTKIIKAEEAATIKTQAEALKAVLVGMKDVIFVAGDIGTFFGSITDADSGGYALWHLKTTLDEMEQLEYLPSQVIPRIVDEATKIAAGMKKMEADFNMVDLKPQLEGILGYDGEHRITIAPEAVNLTVKLQVAIDAEELAATMHKANKTKFDGYFKTTEKVDALGPFSGIFG